MTNPIRALMAQMAAELDHNRRCLLDDATLTHPLADRARYLLAKPADAPAAVAERPSDEELRDLWSWAAGQDQGPWPTQQHAFARAVLARWGQPPASPAEGEVAEMVAWLKENAEYSDYQADPEDAVMFRRTAELLERHAAPVPVPVAERPWEREGWCDGQGRCWFGREESDDWSADWTLATPEAVEEFCLYAPRAVCLPAHVLPLPQGLEVQP